MLKKCVEYLDTALDKIKEIHDEGAERTPKKKKKKTSVSKKNLSGLTRINKAYTTERRTPSDKSLEMVREFFEEFVGIIIMDMTPVRDDVPDITRFISGKMIDRVEVLGNSISLKLSGPGSLHGGYIRVSIYDESLFNDVETRSPPGSNSTYRISFFGGDSIELSECNPDLDMSNCLRYHYDHPRSQAK